MDRKIITFIDKMFDIYSEYSNDSEHPEINWYNNWLSAKFDAKKEDCNIHVEVSFVVSENTVWIKTCCSNLYSDDLVMAQVICKDCMDSHGIGAFSLNQTGKYINLIGIKEYNPDEKYKKLSLYIDKMIYATWFLMRNIKRNWIFPPEKWVDEDALFDE